MEISKIKLVYYSPTGTGKKIGKEISKRTGLEYDYIDLTPLDSESKTYTIPKNELAVIVIPVYGGLIAQVALDRIKKVTSSSGCHVW